MRATTTVRLYTYMDTWGPLCTFTFVFTVQYDPLKTVLYTEFIADCNAAHIISWSDEKNYLPCKRTKFNRNNLLATHMTLSITNDRALRRFIRDNQNCPDPWRGTVYANLRNVSNKKKGDFGEILATNHAIQNGFTVVGVPPDIGHDRIFNDLKTEIKFSLANQVRRASGKVHKDNYFVINHLGMHKDWERFVFIGLNTDSTIVILHFTRENAGGVVEDYFKPQQGGSDGNNDDFMCEITPSKIQRMQQDPRIRTTLDPEDW